MSAPSPPLPPLSARARWPLGWLVLFLAFLPLRAAGSPSLPCHRFTLANGLEAIVHRDPRSPRLAMDLRLAAGAGDDPPGGHGTAHLVEHLLFSGTERFPEGEYDRQLARVGGESNAWTGHDALSFSLVAPATALERVLRLEADRWRALPAGATGPAFEVQRQVVIQEKSETASLPHGRDGEALAAALWPPAHPYHHDALGSLADLASLAPEHVRAWWATHVCPEALTLVLAGDLDPEATEKAVRRWMGTLPACTAAPRPEAPLPTPTRASRRTLLAPTTDATLYLAWPLPPRDHPDLPALKITAHLLSSGAGSRLDDALLHGVRSARRVRAWISAGQLGSELVIRVTPHRRSLSRVLRIVDRELERLRKRGPQARELARIRGAWSGAWLRSLEPLSRRPALLHHCRSVYGDPDCIDEALARHRQVTAEDVRRVMKVWLLPERRTLLSVVPQLDPEQALPGSTALELP